MQIPANLSSIKRSLCKTGHNLHREGKKKIVFLKTQNFGFWFWELVNDAISKAGAGQKNKHIVLSSLQVQLEV